MKNMRLLLITVLILSTLVSVAQDKLYFRDNRIIEGKVLEKKNRFIFIREAGKEPVKVYTDEVAIIIYGDGKSEVLPNKTKEVVSITERNWMIGTNILQFLDGYGGISVEKKITNRYSVRVGQSFGFGINSYGFQSRTAIMNNFYIGKGRVKWLLSAGTLINYNENYYYPIFCFAIGPTDFAPYPPQGFNSNINIGLNAGTGLYLDLTRHLGFSVQLHGSIEPYPWRVWNTGLDICNTGFHFFYKF